MKTREVTLMFKSPCKLQKNKLHSFKSEKKKKQKNNGFIKHEFF